MANGPRARLPWPPFDVLDCRRGRSGTLTILRAYLLPHFEFEGASPEFEMRGAHPAPDRVSPSRPRQPTGNGNRNETNSREPTAFCWRAGPPRVSFLGAVRTRVRQSRDDAHRNFDRQRRDPRGRRVRARLPTLLLPTAILLPAAVLSVYSQKENEHGGYCLCGGKISFRIDYSKGK